MATIAETPTQKLNREAAEKRQAHVKFLELDKYSFSLEKLSEMSGHKVEPIMVLQKTVAKNTTPPSASSPRIIFDLSFFITRSLASDTAG